MPLALISFVQCSLILGTGQRGAIINVSVQLCRDKNPLSVSRNSWLGLVFVVLSKLTLQPKQHFSEALPLTLSLQIDFPSSLLVHEIILDVAF